jgi:hypothetical protein
MQFRRRAAVAIAALSTAALAVGGLAGGQAAAASSPGKVPVVVAHVNAKSIKLSTGSSLHAGRVLFKVTTAKGNHFLQIAKLHHGYPLSQAGPDLNKAFQGDTAAIRRVDKKITFRGGADATPNQPGHFAVTLYAGQYVLIDQNGNAHSFVNVKGKAPARAVVPYQGTITTFTYGFGTTPAHLPASGYVHFQNHSDQPHFVVLQQVKSNTTPKMVREFFNSGGQGNPSFMLKPNASAGVISPKTGEIMQYKLPAGKYVLACFWPDKDTGMPHAFMGMWKLATLG